MKRQIGLFSRMYAKLAALAQYPGRDFQKGLRVVEVPEPARPQEPVLKTSKGSVRTARPCKAYRFLQSRNSPRGY